MSRVTTTVAAAATVLAFALGANVATAADTGLACGLASDRFDPLAVPPLSNSTCNLPTRPVAPDAREGLRVGESLRLVASRPAAPADGQSAIDVRVEVLDADGRPVVRPVLVTLETDAGRIVTPDVANARELPKFLEDRDRRAPGVQVRVVDGAASFTLLAPHEPGRATLVASAGEEAARLPLAFEPDLRPMLAVGILEGSVALDRRNEDTNAPVRTNDGLEEELNTIGLDRRGRDVLGLYGRGAFFAKGEVKPGWLLTAQYDSDEQRQRFFRDIQPDQFYPIYGDSSLRGFDAQSTRRGYLRVDRGASNFLFGDFVTNVAPTPELSLGLYSRSLTGARQHFETSRAQLTVYGAKDSTRQVIDEQPGRGTSGPYDVSRGDGIENSEQVELVVRDRNQSSVILSRQPLVRFTDYEFEPFSGRLLFRKPIPSLDANLNPVSIRVTYEVDGGGPQFWVAGANGRVQLGDRLQLGGSYARDDDPFTPYELASVNATLVPWAGASLVVERAQSTRDAAAGQNATDGAGWRAEFRHAGEQLQARLFYGRTDADFDNPAATLNGGRSEAGGKVAWTFAKRTDLTVEALQTSDVRVGADRFGASATLGHWLNDTFRVDVGVRHFDDEVAGGAGNVVTLSPVYTLVPSGSYGSGSFVNGALRAGNGTTARVRLTARPGDRWLAYVEGEQGLEDSEQHALAIGGEYQVLERTRLYARHEYATGLSGLYSLNGAESSRATVVGADTEYMRDGQLFSEYRLRSALPGREGEAALGLRNLWRLREGLALSTTLERVQAVSGDGPIGGAGGATGSGGGLGGGGLGGSGTGLGFGGTGAGGESTAAALGLEYTAPALWKSSARLEYRDDPASDGWLSTFAFTRKLSRDWSLLARNLYFRNAYDGAGQGARTQDRAIVGAAFRETDTNRWSALFRYELKHERDTSTTLPVDRDAQVVSMHANFQPRRGLVFSGQLAAKRVVERFDDVRSSYDAVLVGGRALWDVTERWDAGVNAAVLAAGAGRARQYGLGIETGYVLVDNLWLSVGWNLVGFTDRDLVESDYTRRGAYVRLRFKFDEKLFGRRSPRVNRVLEPEADLPAEPGSAR